MRLITSLLIVPLLLLFVSTPGHAENEAEPAVTEVPTVEAAADPTIVDRFNEGGWPMYFLLLLAILSIGIIMERFVNLNRGNVSPAGFGEEADKLWQAGNYDGVKDLCQKNGSTLANALLYCVNNRDDDYDTVNEGAGEIASRDFRRHLQTNYWLAVVATLSPLLGLLGTILGMIESFAVVAIAGEIGDIGTVAGGISKALVTTAFGLIVAVPSLAGFHFFKGRVTQLAIRLEDDSSAIIKKWFGKKSAS